MFTHVPQLTPSNCLHHPPLNYFHSPSTLTPTHTETQKERDSERETQRDSFSGHNKMMKWGRKKPSSSSSSSSSTSSSIFPKSWFSKLMHRDITPDHKPGKSSPKPNPQPQTAASQTTPPGPVSSGLKNARFHGPGDDVYSSIYSQSGVQRVRGNSLSVVLDKFDDERETCRDCNRDVWKFNDMVSGVQKLKGFPQSVSASPEVVKNVAVEGERGREELFEPGRKAAKDQKLRRTCRRILEQKMQELARIPEEEIPEEKDIFEAKKVPHTRKNSDSYEFEDLNSKERFELSGEKANSEWKQLKEMKIREVKSKGEKQRKSVYISREQHRRPKQSCRVKAYSPRTAARIECKIKALEDMKKARMMRKIRHMNGVEKTTLSESYAVAKSSFDPELDFRSSMIEMITEKGIKRPEELEELLACYLTLNADEYHDLIIKVFRQVWFELNKECFGPEK